MKKLSSVFLSAVSLVALTTGCSSSEVIEEGPALQTGAITFGATNVAKASRAAETAGTQGVLNNENFAKFHVFGTYSMGSKLDVQIFTGDPVTKSVNMVDGKEVVTWEYTGERYWLENATYNFYAYSCGNMADKLSEKGYAQPVIVNDHLEIQDFYLHGYHDLVFAQVDPIVVGNYKQDPSTTQKPPSQVNFRFQHILTRLRFSFKGEVPDENYIMEVSDINIFGLLNKATYNAGNNGRWTNYAKDKTDLSINIKGVVDKDGKDVAEDVYGKNMVPCNETGDVLTCTPIFVIPNQEYMANPDNENTMELIFKMTVSRKRSGGLEPVPVVQRIVTASWEPNWSQGMSVNNVITLSFSDATGLEPIKFSAQIVPTEGQDDDNDTWVNDVRDLDVKFESQAVPNTEN